MSVGIGDSATLRQIKAIEALERRRVAIFDPFKKEFTTDKNKVEMHNEMARRSLFADVFITSSNAITLDGKIVNVDHIGNRVAAMIYGPKSVIIVAGRNKLVEDVDEALHRIKNVIAPYHCKTKKIPTPCAKTLKCNDCKSPRRICNVVTILERRPKRTRTTVILVDEDLGLSWNEAWPKDRIEKIKSNYEKVTWAFTPFLDQDHPPLV